MGCISCIGSLTSGVTKLILFVFNFVIFLCGILLIVVGAIALSNTFKYDVNNVAIFAIVLGVIIGLIAFCGCWGVIQQSKCLLTTYAVILLIIFVIQIILAVIAFIAVKDGADFTDRITSYLKDLYKDYWTDENSRKIVNAFQMSYECCGLNGPSGSEVINKNGDGLITSCCASNTTTCTASIAFSKGCQTALEDAIRTLFHYSGGIAIGFGVVELVSAIFALCVRPKY